MLNKMYLCRKKNYSTKCESQIDLRWAKRSAPGHLARSIWDWTCKLVAKSPSSLNSWMLEDRKWLKRRSFWKSLWTSLAFQSSCGTVERVISTSWLSSCWVHRLKICLHTVDASWVWSQLSYSLTNCCPELKSCTSEATSTEIWNQKTSSWDLKKVPQHCS